MANQPQRWVIVGAGYTGSRLAKQLCKAGHTVVVTRTQESGRQQTANHLPLAKAVTMRLDRREDYESIFEPDDRVVLLAPPGDEQALGESQLALFLGKLRIFRLVYVSSTGVYSSGEGQWVDETYACQPTSEHGIRRLRAEVALLQAAQNNDLSLAMLRAPGIYGPGRGVQERIRLGQYQVLGAGDSMVSRVHVDDLVAAILVVMAQPSLQDAIYNVSDDAPDTSRSVADGVCALLQRPPVASQDESTASEFARSMLTANRKISNRLLKSLGWRPHYPSWKEGMAQALAEVGVKALGKLE